MDRMLHNYLKKTSILFLCLLFPVFAYAEQDNFRIRAHQLDISSNSEEDIDAEIRFGKTISARILGQYSIYQDEKLNRYVSLVGKSLALNSSRDDIEFRFSVLDADFINAYSAPGGYIFITKGAISAMQDEAELAAVLAHEIAHITEKHIVKEFKIKGQEKGATAGVSRLLGSSKSSTQAIFSKAVDGAVEKLLNKGFKQKDELDADRIALLLLANTGYDPSALSRYLKRIKKITKKNAKKMKHKPTHPPTGKRIKSLKQISKLESLDKLNFPRAKSRFEKHVKK
jgi:predicted Zn-dependent protease